jgi:uncharacterized membrane-anchored protein YitT (DUF2179 family)
MLLFIYSSTYAIITSISYAIVFILGGSTAGSDYITVYLSEKKNKSIGAMFMILNLSFLLMGVSIGTFASASYIRYEYLN